MSNIFKKDFPIFKHNSSLVYLDNAATSQTPEQVLRIMSEYYTQYRASVHRGLYAESEKTTEQYEKVREQVAHFIGGESEEIIFTGGATSSMDILIRSLDKSGFFKKGDEIVVSIMEHHSTLLPLQEIAKIRGISLKVIPLQKNGAELDYKKAEELITEKTTLVCVTLSSNVLGTVNDIQKISKFTHTHKALLIVDAAKAVSHISIDVKELGVDFLFFSGHKMFGPTGTGVLWGRQELLEKLPPGIVGGGIVEEVTLEGATWVSSPYRFEAGTPNISGVLGLGGAVSYIQSIGMEAVERHNNEILQYGIEVLGDIPECQIFSEKEVSQNTGIISFTISGIHPHDISTILAKEGVAVRAGHHCAEPLIQALGVSGGLTRASISLYNTKEDIDILARAIKKAIKIFS